MIWAKDTDKVLSICRKSYYKERMKKKAKGRNSGSESIAYLSDLKEHIHNEALLYTKNKSFKTS